MVTVGFGRDDPRQWVKAAYVILDALESGSRGPHDPVPSAAELAAMLGVSPGTPKRAFRELAEMGILYRVQGLGYFPDIRGLR
jgi:DNA-binding GntR family transcriptional regulator